jgi:hypothetical protein
VIRKDADFATGTAPLAIGIQHREASGNLGVTWLAKNSRQRVASTAAR